MQGRGVLILTTALCCAKAGVFPVDGEDGCALPLEHLELWKIQVHVEGEIAGRGYLKTRGKGVHSVQPKSRRRSAEEHWKTRIVLAPKCSRMFEIF